MRWVEESALPGLDLATLQRELGLQARRKGAAGRTAADSCSGTWPRTRSLNAPSPIQQFGPCGRIMKNSAMVM